MAAKGRRGRMIFQRSQRRVLGYAIATAVAFAAPAFAKSEDKAKPTDSATAKLEDKAKPAKSAAAKPAKAPEKAAKPAKKVAAAKAARKTAIPLPRARPL